MSWKLHLLGKGEPDLSRTSPALHRQWTWSLGHRVPQQWRFPCWSTQQRCTRWGRLQTLIWSWTWTLFPFWIPPISGVKKACFGCRSLCFQGHLYSTTLTGQPSEYWHFWILSTLAPRKSLDGEIKKPFGMSFSLWWVWLATRWYALRALSSCNNHHSLAFCGSLSSWMGGGHDFTRPLSSTNFLAFSAGFFSGVFFKWHICLANSHRYSSSGEFVSSGARTFFSMFWE